MKNKKNSCIQRLWLALITSSSILSVASSHVYSMREDEGSDYGDSYKRETPDEGFGNDFSELSFANKKVKTDEDQKAQDLYASIVYTNEGLTHWAFEISQNDFTGKLSKFMEDPKFESHPTNSSLWSGLYCAPIEDPGLFLFEMDEEKSEKLVSKQVNTLLENAELWKDFLQNASLSKKVFELVVQHDQIKFEQWQSVLAQHFNEPKIFLPQAELFLTYCDIKEDSFSQKNASISAGSENVMGLEKTIFKHVIEVIAKSMSQGNFYTEPLSFTLHDFLKSWYEHTRNQLSQDLAGTKKKVDTAIFNIDCKDVQKSVSEAEVLNHIRTREHQLKEELANYREAHEDDSLGYFGDDIEVNYRDWLYKTYEEYPGVKNLLKELFKIQTKKQRYSMLEDTTMAESQYDCALLEQMVNQDPQDGIWNFFINSGYTSAFLTPKFPLYLLEQSIAFSVEQVFFYAKILKIQEIFTSLEKGSIRWTILDWLNDLGNVFENGIYFDGLNSAINKDSIFYSEVLSYKLQYVDKILHQCFGDMSSIESLLKITPPKINALNEQFGDLFGNPLPKDLRIEFKNHRIPMNNLSKNLCDRIKDCFFQKIGGLMDDIAEFSKNCLRAHNEDIDYIEQYRFFLKDSILFVYSIFDNDTGLMDDAHPFFEPKEELKIFGKPLESILKSHMKTDKEYSLKEISDNYWKKNSKMLLHKFSKQECYKQLCGVFGAFLTNHPNVSDAESCSDGVFVRLIFELCGGKWGLFDVTKVPNISFNCEGGMK